MTIYLTLRQAMIVAQAAVGTDVRVADPGLLASALARPAMSAFGEDAYPTLARKAAALMESLARNHTLVDGNKRLAWTSTVAFLRMNGFDLTYASVDEAEAFVLAVTADHLELGEIESWIAERITPR